MSNLCVPSNSSTEGTKNLFKVALNSVWALLYTSVLIFLSLLSAKWTVPFIFLESVTVNVATIFAGLLTVVGPKCKAAKMGIQKAEPRKGTNQDTSLDDDARRS